MLKYIAGCAIVGVLLVTVSLAAAEDEKVYREVKLTRLAGDVLVKVAGTGMWKPATTGMVLRQNDEIRTEKNATATIIFDEEGSFTAKEHDSIDITPDTELVLAKLTYNTKTKDKTTLLDLTVGKIVANASKLRTKDSKFEVKTPTSIVGVRGTNYVVEYRPGK